MRWCRANPVLASTVLGASIGLANAIILALAPGPLSVMTNHVLFLLWPTSIVAFEFFDADSIPFAAFLLIAEFGGNAVIYAFVFAAPVCLVVAISRSFGTPATPASILPPK